MTEAKEMTPVSKVKITYQDYLLLPECDVHQYELIDGRLHMVPAPIPYHQRVLVKLIYFLEAFVTERGLGEILVAPCDVVLSETDVVQPDLFFISEERSHIMGEKAIQGAPDLIVEIFSPSTRQRDQGIKRKLYAQHGVKEYWLVDPDAKSVEVLRWSVSGYETVEIYSHSDTLRSPLWTALELNLADIFKEA